MIGKMQRKLKRSIRKGRVLGSKVKRTLLGRAPMDYSGPLSVKPIKHDASSFERDQRVYREHSTALLNNSQKSDAYAVAIGSVDAEAFNYFGKMEADLLYQYGLSDESFLVDVGCGSGRLALALHSAIGFHHLDFCLSALLIKLQKADSVIVPAFLVLGTLLVFLIGFFLAAMIVIP